MSGKSLICSVLASLVLFASWCAEARDIQPPLVALRAPATNLIAARVVEISADPPSIRVEVSQTLRGHPRDALTIKVAPAVLAHLGVGLDYLLVYGDLVPVRGKRGSFMRVDEGTLASLDGASPALFRDIPEMRALLDPAHEKAERATGYKSTVLAGLKQPDPHLQDLWAGELAYRGELIEALTDADRATIAAFVSSPDSPPAARARLLRAATVYGTYFGDWVADAARRIVTTERVDPGAGLRKYDELVFVAFEIVRADPRPLDVAALSRWVRSSAPLLAEQALLKLRAQSPETERGVIEAALAEQLLPTATRSFLIDHLRRLDLARAAAG